MTLPITLRFNAVFSEMQANHFIAFAGWLTAERSEAPVSHCRAIAAI
jgi:hypothetical protein